MSETEEKPAVKLARAMQTKLATVADERHQTTTKGVTSTKTVQEIIIDQLATAACEGKEWAIEKFLQYIEGKPTQQSSTDRDEQASYDRISDTTTQHINGISARVRKKKPADSPRVSPPPQFTDARPANNPPVAAPTGAARRLLGLPQDGN
jgi:hypothetical protein